MKFTTGVNMVSAQYQQSCTAVQTVADTRLVAKA